MEVGSFGSAVLWLLITFPAYWLFQWMIEGEPFSLWQRQPGNIPTTLVEEMGQTLAEAQVSLTVAASGQRANAKAA